LKEIDVKFAASPLATIDGIKSPVWNTIFRTALRVLCLHKKKIISEAEWKEFQEFFKRVNIEEEYPWFLREWNSHILTLQKNAKSPLDPLEILELCYYVCHC
jgi:hypothetical protein